MDARLTLKQLYYFAALAEAGHYRKAAETAGISQPSLSQQIAKLEEVLRLSLVERGKAGAVLTPEGREVLDRARRILADVAELREISEQMRKGFAGTIRLGSSPTLGPYLLPNVLRRLHEHYPELRLFIRDGAPRALLEDLLAGRHDVILTQLPVQSSDITVTRLLREPLRLAVALDHPLARKGMATDSDLANESILALSQSFTLYTQIAQLAHEVGANLRQDYEGTSLDALRQMVAMNMGLTFLPALYAASEIADPGGDVALVPYRDGRLHRSIGIAWRKTAGNHAGFNAFADMIRSVVRERFLGLVQLEAP